MVVMTLGFAIYWFIQESEALRAAFEKRYGKADYTRPWILFTRGMGFLWMGLASIVVILGVLQHPLENYGLRFDFSGKTLLFTGILMAILVPVNLLAGGRPENLRMYPQIRNAVWTKTTLMQSAVGWFLYLLGYEILFRGLLLHGCLPLGVWPAIAINTCIYSVSHIPKGAGETFGAIPFGTVLCWMTLETGSITTAVVAHLALALSNEWVALRKHPDMRLQ
jgi:hypothetical protein